MPVLCIGPVCIPLNLLLPFLLGVAHHYGWLKFIKREWVTLQHWKQKFTGQPATTPGNNTQGPGSVPSAATQKNQRVVCEGGVCRLVPDDSAVAAAAASGGDSISDAAITNPPAAAAGGTLQKRRGLEGVRAVDM